MPSTETLNQSPTIASVNNDDLLWVWDTSASALNKIQRISLITTTDDVNSSYALLAGRSGGQTLIGGTAANDDLTLEGTSDATRTTSYVVIQPNGGNVGIGTTSFAADVFGTHKLNLYTTTNEGLQFGRFSANNGGPVLSFIKSRSATVGSNTVVLANDRAGTIAFSAADGTGYDDVAQIAAEVDAVTGSTIMSGRLMFLTTDTTGTRRERVRIDDDGNIGIGTTSFATDVFGTHKLNLYTTTNEGLQFGRFSADNGGPVLSFIKSRSATIDSNTVVLANDRAGTIAFSAADGTGYDDVAQIAAEVDAVTGSTTMSGRLMFLTTDTTGTRRERVRIDDDGNVGIGTTSPDTRLDIDAGAIEFAEMTAPAAGAANTGRLFCRDNGSGKTQLCVIFNTGAIQVIATQP